MYLWRYLASLENTYMYIVSNYDLCPERPFSIWLWLMFWLGRHQRGADYMENYSPQWLSDSQEVRESYLTPMQSKQLKGPSGFVCPLVCECIFLPLFGARATSLNISSPKDQTMLLSKTSALVWTTDSVEQGLCTNGDYHPLNMLPFMCLFRTYINP